MRFSSFFRSDIPANIQSLSLWKESEYGMTPAQIKELFPSAQSPSSPDELYGGAKELLRISDVEIVGHKFKSSFFFKSHRLVQVMLFFKCTEIENDGMEIFNLLSDALRQKYGTELSNKDDSTSSISTSFTLIWLSGRTYINLSYTKIGRDYVSFTINYNVHLPPKR